eukprot:30087-Pelagococcus_subviridis.AAC.7
MPSSCAGASHLIIAEDTKSSANGGVFPNLHSGALRSVMWIPPRVTTVLPDTVPNGGFALPPTATGGVKHEAVCHPMHVFRRHISPPSKAPTITAGTTTSSNLHSIDGTNAVPRTRTSAPPLVADAAGCTDITDIVLSYVNASSSDVKSTMFPLTSIATGPGACAGVVHSIACVETSRDATGENVPTLQSNALGSSVFVNETRRSVPPRSPPAVRVKSARSLGVVVNSNDAPLTLK